MMFMPFYDFFLLEMNRPSFALQDAIFVFEFDVNVCANIRRRRHLVTGAKI